MIENSPQISQMKLQKYDAGFQGTGGRGGKGGGVGVGVGKKKGEEERNLTATHFDGVVKRRD